MIGRRYPSRAEMTAEILRLGAELRRQQTYTAGLISFALVVVGALAVKLVWG